jgi:hypothetical protein
MSNIKLTAYKMGESLIVASVDEDLAYLTVCDEGAYIHDTEGSDAVPPINKVDSDIYLEIPDLSLPNPSPFQDAILRFHLESEEGNKVAHVTAAFIAIAGCSYKDYKFYCEFRIPYLSEEEWNKWR